jgi:hypothetical protein
VTVRGTRWFDTEWTFEGVRVTPRGFHRLLRTHGSCPVVPIEVRCGWCKHLLYLRLVNMRRALPFPLWCGYMLVVRGWARVVRLRRPTCQQCRFNREVRGW